VSVSVSALGFVSVSVSVSALGSVSVSVSVWLSASCQFASSESRVGRIVASAIPVRHVPLELSVDASCDGSSSINPDGKPKP
jgi:hypothetical protein